MEKIVFRWLGDKLIVKPVLALYKTRRSSKPAIGLKIILRMEEDLPLSQDSPVLLPKDEIILSEEASFETENSKSFASQLQELGMIERTRKVLTINGKKKPVYKVAPLFIDTCFARVSNVPVYAAYSRQFEKGEAEALKYESPRDLAAALTKEGALYAPQLSLLLQYMEKEDGVFVSSMTEDEGKNLSKTFGDVVVLAKKKGGKLLRKTAAITFIESLTKKEAAWFAAADFF